MSVTRKLLARVRMVERQRPGDQMVFANSSQISRRLVQSVVVCKKSRAMGVSTVRRMLHPGLGSQVGLLGEVEILLRPPMAVVTNLLLKRQLPRDRLSLSLRREDQLDKAQARKLSAALPRVPPRARQPQTVLKFIRAEQRSLGSKLSHLRYRLRSQLQTGQEVPHLPPIHRQDHEAPAAVVRLVVLRQDHRRRTTSLPLDLLHLLRGSSGVGRGRDNAQASTLHCKRMQLRLDHKV